MVAGKTFNVMIQRIEASRRKNTSLTHATANELANAVRTPYEGFRASQNSANRRAQPLRQAQRNCVHISY